MRRVLSSPSTASRSYSPAGYAEAEKKAGRRTGYRVYLLPRWRRVEIRSAGFLTNSVVVAKTSRATNRDDISETVSERCHIIKRIRVATRNSKIGADVRGLTLVISILFINLPMSTPCPCSAPDPPDGPSLGPSFPPLRTSSSTSTSMCIGIAPDSDPDPDPDLDPSAPSTSFEVTARTSRCRGSSACVYVPSP